MRRHSRSWSLVVVALAFPACTGGGEELPQNEDGCEGAWYEPYMAELPTRVGDVACVGDTLDGPAVDSRCVGEASLVANAVDHQSSDPTGGITVDLFFNDAFNGQSDASKLSNENGALTGLTVPTCTAVAYKSVGDPDTTAETYGMHRIWPALPSVEQDFRSVGTGTISIVSLGFGVSSEEGKGMVFGKATACDMDSALEGVQVLLRDGDCKIPEGSATFVGYTTAKLPDPTIRATSTDGYYFAMNVPPGEWVAEMYEQTGDGYRLLGSAPLVVKADAVTLVDIAAGRDDGLLMPDECLACE